jgi:phosphoribosyl 1,2-cyclic phosphodiesterase
VKLTFAGTRGYIEARTRRHRMHAALDVAYQKDRIRIDCGADWRSRIDDIRAAAILVTHAHPDHADGLKDGARCPVYATEESWKIMDGYPIEEPQRRPVYPRTPFDVGGIRIEAFPAVHSTRAPAVGYRIRAGRHTVFYAPDLVYIEDRAAALAGVRLYIGDGATVDESFVRKIDRALVGHTPVRTQLTWCGKEGVPEAIVTHCGSQIVEGDERTLGAQIRRMGKERGVKATIAHDGMERVLR